jgi:hypothetical protein
MLTTKMIEIRDSGTFIPVIATKMVSISPDERYLLVHAGYGEDEPLILITEIDGSSDLISHYDPDEWAWESNLTLSQAHKYIAEHFDEIPNCGVVDVEYIRGDRAQPKQPQRLTDKYYRD